MTLAEQAFAEYFSAWNITIPADLADGQLNEHGWSIRVRRTPAGGIEFRAGHRMTNERWVHIAPDGTLTHEPVPGEGYGVPPGGDRAAIEAEYRASWRAYGEKVTARGMDWID